MKMKYPKGIVLHSVCERDRLFNPLFYAAADHRSVYRRGGKVGGAGGYLNLAVYLPCSSVECFSLAWGNAVYFAAVICKRFGFSAADVKGNWECFGSAAPYWVGRYDTMENFRRM